MLKSVIVIGEEGLLSLWNDDMVGEAKIVARPRASHIEENPDRPGYFCVQLSQHELNGEYAGLYLAGDDLVTSVRVEAYGFTRKADAEAAEKDFINHCILLKGVDQ